MALELIPGIVVDPAVRSGRPVIRGTRVPVGLIIAKLAGGMTSEDVAEEYEITTDDVRAALSYTAKILGSEGW
jgi:uncharacterized protein (DUF433 family)